MIQSYYKIGPFRISISFDDNELGKKVTEKLAYVCPAALGYETILEGIEDCKCSIF